MSEINEEVVDTPTAEDSTLSGVEEAASFLNEQGGGDEASEEPGFLETIGQQLEEAAGVGDDQDFSEEEDSSSEDVELEGEEDISSEDSSEEDLAEDFPTADELKDVLDDDRKVAKWGELRGELEQARSQVRDLESKLDDTQKQSIASELEKELSEARAKAKEYEDELAVARVERSPDYQKVVVEPLQALMDAAENLAARNELDVDAVFDVLAAGTSSPRAIKEIEVMTEQMSEVDKFSFYRMTEDANQIFAKDAQLKANAAEAVAELEQRETAEQEAANKKHVVAVRENVRKVFDKLGEVTPELSEGEELEKLMDKTLSDDFGTLDTEHQAYALSAANMLPPLIKALRARDVTIAKLQKDVAGYSKASPKVAPSGSGVKTPSPDKSGKELGFFEAMDKHLTEAGM